jgi:hypothetical protein
VPEHNKISLLPLAGTIRRAFRPKPACYADTLVDSIHRLLKRPGMRKTEPSALQALRVS